MFKKFKTKNLMKTKNLKLKIVLIVLVSLILNLKSAPPALAGPKSSSFELKEYGFGAGGVATSSSNNYMFQGIAGEIETASLSSTNFQLGPGLTYTLQPNTPGTPNFSNPSNYYSKLKIIIDNGGNSTDTTFAIQISTNNFVSNFKYVQSADHTLGVNPDWQTYSTWNSGTGITIIGLNPGTTYYARVAAKRGTYQQGRYGGIATAATVNSSFTFNIQTSTQASPPYTIGIGVVNAGQVTTSWQSVNTSISTNANNGGTIYLYDANSGLKSTTAGNYTIASASNDLNSILEGYGAQGTTVSQSSGGPMRILSPYNVSANSVGVLDNLKRPFADSTSTPITNGQASFQLKAKASTTTPSANDYADTLTVIASGSF